MNLKDTKKNLPENLIQLQKCGKVEEARARLVRSVGVVWLEGYIVYKV